MYDLIILGTGPAGMTAQIYAIRYNLKVLSLGGVVGGLMMESHKICNWPGEPGITGTELTQKMKHQVDCMEGEMKLENAKQIELKGDHYVVTTVGGKTYTGKHILFTIGTEHKHLGLEVEAKYAGKGVAYCATCDAMFYKGKVVGVVGGGNSAMTAALYLADICPKVYLIYRGEELKGEVSWLKDVKSRDNIVAIKKTNVVDLKGESKLEALVLDNEYEGSKEIEAAGLFIEIGTRPRSEIFKAMGGEVDDWGYIKIKANQSTNLPNVWAAGDITNGSNNFRQIATACGEAAVAADSVFKAIKTSKTQD